MITRLYSLPQKPVGREGEAVDGKLTSSSAIFDHFLITVQEK